jgi:hypothetical protein
MQRHLPLLLALAGCPKPSAGDGAAIDLGDDAVGEAVDLQFGWEDGWKADTKVHVTYEENGRVLVDERTASNVRIQGAQGALFLVWGEGEVRPVTQVAPPPTHSWLGLHLHLVRRPIIERVELTGEFSGAGRVDLIDQAQQEAYDEWSSGLLEGLRGRSRTRREAQLEAGRRWFSEEQAQAILLEEHESVTSRWVGKALEVGKMVEERGSIYVPSTGGPVGARIRLLAEGSEPCPGSPRRSCAVLRRDSEADSRFLTRNVAVFLGGRAEILGTEPPRVAHAEAQRIERIWVESETLRPWREEDVLVTILEHDDGREEVSRESVIREWTWTN